ncbi:GNAT family N-acetyltransferase [Xenorhabdus kozodoii]|uniref:N-acetyltransferase n=1 Tax=Xenorhabdus kozodoii TaxID=351676 RepID=A0A2D0LE53_9GAMM|nr:GNAT family N-acetyltransferase [Xenorhabdus kozodoii]PHM73984.1 N-acetyltransferase [Xenorhabdus kozodoii]
MLKRSASFNNSHIRKTHNSDIKKTDSLSRSTSFHALPPKSILNIDVNYKNPILIRKYKLAIRETDLNKGLAATNQLYTSIITDGWISHINDMTKREKEIYKKQEKTREDLWDMRCCITHNLLNKLKNHLNRLNKMEATQNYTFFVGYNNTKPIGVMLIRKYHTRSSGVKAISDYPEINYLITHPSIQNYSYLLMEKAVNMSYQMGYLGKLQLIIATDELAPNVYERMGFIRIKELDNTKMILDPNGNKAWIFSPAHGGYRFTGAC